MKTDKDWEARARELMEQCRLGGHDPHQPFVRRVLSEPLIRCMLQLGREMVSEAQKHRAAQDVLDAEGIASRAADARAEEIAKRCEFYLSDAESIRGTTSIGMIPGLKAAANLARSTITKPKEPETLTMKLKNDGAGHFSAVHPDEAAIRADEREKVAKRIEACDGQWNNVLGEPVICVATAAAVSRAGEPKTRGQVLEDALRAARHDAILLGLDETRRSIDRALEWRPEKEP